MADPYAYEARRRAHQLRREGLSQRAIARELGLSRRTIQDYLAQSVRGDDGRGGRADVRNLQEVWTDLSIADSGHWGVHPARKTRSAVLSGGRAGVYTLPSGMESFETDDDALCVCGWALNCRHLRTGEVHVWKRGPDMEGAARTRMLWTCPVHNPEMVQEQAAHIGYVAPPSIFCYRFEAYAHADTARRAAYRLNKRGEDGSYILVSRRDFTGLYWDMASSVNLTRRDSTAIRAKTVEVETRKVLPLLSHGLGHLPTLRAVSARYQWQPPADSLDTEQVEEREVEYETMTSGQSRTIYEVSPAAIGRQIGPRDVVTEDEWGKLGRYLRRSR